MHRRQLYLTLGNIDGPQKKVVDYFLREFIFPIELRLRTRNDRNHLLYIFILELIAFFFRFQSWCAEYFSDGQLHDK